MYLCIQNQEKDTHKKYITYKYWQQLFQAIHMTTNSLHNHTGGLKPYVIDISSEFFESTL